MLPIGDLPFKIQPDQDESRKICFLVKLTDSSVRSIEEYLKNNRNNASKKPSIMFQKDRGEIVIPEAKASDAGNKSALKKFQFALSSTKEAINSSAKFECIQYANNKLRTLGSIEQKLTVQANEDVWQTTKEKVNKQVEEEKKNATIEIRASGAIVNRPAINPTTTTSTQNRPKPVLSAPKPVQNVNASSQSQSANTSLNASTETSSGANTKPTRNAAMDRSMKERLDLLESSGPIRKPIEKENFQASASLSFVDAQKLKPSFVDKQKEIEQGELETCKQKYKEITNRKQRDDYQKEIDQIYGEYLELHNLMESVSAQYHKYETELGAIKEDQSKEYQEKCNRILRDYLEKQNDSDFVKKRERFALIFTKLNFLHDLCKKYDSSLSFQ